MLPCPLCNCSFVDGTHRAVPLSHMSQSLPLEGKVARHLPRRMRCSKLFNNQVVAVLPVLTPHQSTSLPAGGELPLCGKRSHPGVSPRGEALTHRTVSHSRGQQNRPLVPPGSPVLLCCGLRIVSRILILLKTGYSGILTKKFLKSVINNAIRTNSRWAGPFWNKLNMP